MNKDMDTRTPNELSVIKNQTLLSIGLIPSDSASTENTNAEEQALAPCYVRCPTPMPPKPVPEPQEDAQYEPGPSEGSTP